MAKSLIDLGLGRKKKGLLDDIGLDLGFDQPEPKSSAYELPEIDDGQSLLGIIGQKVVGGAEYIGSTLDKLFGGRAVRGLLGGKPREVLSLLPGSDVLGLTDAKDTVSGRDLLGENTPGFDWLDVPGFALEVALDPATYLTLGAGTAGKGAKLLKKADVVDDLIVKTSAAAKDSLSTRQALRRSGTIEDVYKTVKPSAQKRLDDAAGGPGKIADFDKLSAAADARFHIPGVVDKEFNLDFVAGALGKAKQAPLVGGAISDLADKASWLGRRTRATFDREVAGTIPAYVQGLAKQMTRAADADEVRIRKRTARDITTLTDANELTVESSDQIRRLMEGIGRKPHIGSATSRAMAKSATPTQQAIAKGLRHRDDQMLALDRALGKKKEELTDYSGILHSPRSGSGVGFGGTSSRALNTIDPTGKARVDPLKNWQDGTETVREIIRDPEVMAAADIDEAAQVIRQRYGSQFMGKSRSERAKEITRYLKIKGGFSGVTLDELTRGWKEGPMVIDAIKNDPDFKSTLAIKRAKDLVAKKYAKQLPHTSRNQAFRGIAEFARTRITPEQRDVGFFGHDVLFDAQEGHIAAARSQRATKAMHQGLADMAKPADQFAPNDGSRTLREVLRASGGLMPNKSLERIARKLGHKPQDIDSDLLKNIGRMRVPDEIAAGLLKLNKGYQGPQAESEMLKLVDSFTNLFKAFTLSWPARVSRDVVSGQVTNATANKASRRSVSDAWKLLRGGEPERLAEIPAIQRELTERGMPVNPATAARLMREEIYGHGLMDRLQGSHSAGNIAGVAHGMSTGTTGDLSRALAGAKPFSLREMLTKQPDDTWWPLDIRGVKDSRGAIRTDSTFYPVRVMESLGTLGDTMNRLPPFLESMYQGHSASSAAKLANQLQVDYRLQKFTPFEQQWAVRAIPFYKWHSRMIPYMLRELATHPGGGLAQLNRGMSIAGSDDQGFIPEYLQGGLNIPLGDVDPETGTRRYITQSGLPLEAFNMLHFGPGGWTKSGLDVMGMANPLPKGIVEQLVGRQFYSDRDLRDLDPRLGRILSNIGLTDDPRVVPQPVEQMVMNSPLSRLMGSIGQVTDGRKTLLQKFANLGTGLRISDIDEAKQAEIEARDLINDIVRGQSGISFYESPYVQDPELVTPETLRQIGLLKALQKQARQRREKMATRP